MLNDVALMLSEYIYVCIYIGIVFTKKLSTHIYIRVYEFVNIRKR